MTISKSLISLFKKKKISFFTGVPDSVLKNFLSLAYSEKKINHIVATSEGSAVGLAIGNYLTSGKLSLVYLQNSGLGNAINPLISVADKKVYSIPLVLLIGWRGAPNTKDEPQHMTKGKITKKLLSNLNIPTLEITSKTSMIKISKFIDKSTNQEKPVAILVKNGVLEKEKKISTKNNHNISRSNFILHLLKILRTNDRVISTTGYTSREVNQLRNQNKLYKGKDFYMVGGMGHSASVALGCSLNVKNKIICLDGDGSSLMHLGSIFTAANFGKKNYKYILLNNQAHQSVGGNRTYSEQINFKNLSLSLGFKNYFKIDNKKDLKKIINKFYKSNGPDFMEVKINNETLPNLKRPKDFIKIKKNFMLTK